MSALHAVYLTEIIEAHREGLRILRELATAETDPAERRRLAIALVRARPIKDPNPEAAAPAPDATRPAKSRQSREIHPANDTPAQTHADTPAPNHSASQSNAHYEIRNPQSQDPLPPAPPGFKDCTHPALPPYPSMHIKQLLKRARSA